MTVILSNKVDGTTSWDELPLRGLDAMSSGLADEKVDWEFMTYGSVVLSSKTEDGFYPYPLPYGVPTMYCQKCVDTMTEEWVYWTTIFADVNGALYPGNGFDPSTYKIETIVHGRTQ